MLCSLWCPPTLPTERYGEQHPVWQECGWGEAASRAHQEAKFLFVYLHSPQHQVRCLQRLSCGQTAPGIAGVLPHPRRNVAISSSASFSAVFPLQDTDAFCRGTLCDPGFAAFVNQHFVAWGGDLRRSDAFR